MKILISLMLVFSTKVFANSQAVPLSVVATTTSTQVLPYNNLRSYLLIQNIGSNTIVVKMNSAQTGTEGVQIPPGGNYEPYGAPVNAVYIETLTGSSAVTIVQGQ